MDISTESNNIISITCGGFWTFIITNNGGVWGTGANNGGQLGLGHKSTVIKFTRLEKLENVSIRKIATGYHTIALSIKREVFYWGTGSFGEVTVPQRMNLKEDIKDISIGGTLGLALDFNGKVWTWGSNSLGELGVEDFEPRITPCQITRLDKKLITNIFCGESFVIALGCEYQSELTLRSHTKQFSLLETSINVKNLPDEHNEKNIKDFYLPNDTLFEDNSLAEASCSITQQDPNKNLVAVLTRQREYLENVLEKEANKRKQIENNCSELNNQIIILKKEIVQLEDQKAEDAAEMLENLTLARNKIEDMAKKITELKNLNEKLNKELNIKESQLNEANLTKDDIKNKYIDVKKKLKEYIDTQTKLVKENENLIQKILHKEQIESNNKIEKFTNDSVNKMNAEIRILKNTIEELNEKCKAFKKEKELLRSKYEDKKIELIQCKSDIKSLQQELEIAKKESEAIKYNLSNEETNTEDLTFFKHQKNDEVIAIENENESLMKKMAQLEDQSKIVTYR